MYLLDHNQNHRWYLVDKYLELGDIFHAGLSRATVGMADLEHAWESTVAQLHENKFTIG